WWLYGLFFFLPATVHSLLLSGKTKQLRRRPACPMPPLPQRGIGGGRRLQVLRRAASRRASAWTKAKTAPRRRGAKGRAVLPYVRRAHRGGAMVGVSAV